MCRLIVAALGFLIGSHLIIQGDSIAAGGQTQAIRPLDINFLIRLFLNQYVGQDATDIGIKGSTTTNLSPSSRIDNWLNSISDTKDTRTRITGSRVSTGNSDLRRPERRALDYTTLMNNVVSLLNRNQTLDSKTNKKTEFAPEFGIMDVLNSLSNTDGFGSEITGATIKTGDLQSTDQGRLTTRLAPQEEPNLINSGIENPLYGLLSRLGKLIDGLLPGLLNSLLGNTGLLTNVLGLGTGGGILGGLLGPRGLLASLLGQKTIYSLGLGDRNINPTIQPLNELLNILGYPRGQPGRTKARRQLLKFLRKLSRSTSN